MVDSQIILLNVRAEPTKEFPQIVVYVRGNEIVLTYGEGEEYTRDQEFYALTKALEEYHGQTQKATHT